jgi:DedD protein
MPKSEDGQYELVLENRQVLVIFLFAALLCGIFFGLGFVVGQSSKGSLTAAKQEPTSTSDRADRKKSALAPAPVSEQPAAVASEPPVAKPPVKEGEATKQAEPANEKPKPEEKAAPAVAPPAQGQETGSINLQVAAFTTREEAEPMAALLKRKNFPANIVPGTTDRLLHVLVGPYPNSKEADAAKKKLEEEGFKPIVKK